MSGHRQPLTAAEQEWIAQGKKEGKTLQKIAKELRCSVRTARKYWRRARDQQIARRPGRPRQGTLSSYAPEIQEMAVQMKREHPGWGALTVRLHLAQALGKDVKEMPSAARLAVLFKERCPEAVQARRKRAYPEQAPSKVSRPHQRWQMDAQEGLSVVSGEKVNLLNLRDPMGLMIGSRAFLTTTEKRWRKITLQEVQQALRQAFAEWGLPDEIQTDHETVYVGSSDENFPSLFTLWLTGLGITHLTSRPARPTDQGAVEREHRTLSDMACKGQSFSDLEDLQPRWTTHAAFTTIPILPAPRNAIDKRLCRRIHLHAISDVPLTLLKNGGSSTWNAPIASLAATSPSGKSAKMAASRCQVTITPLALNLPDRPSLPSSNRKQVLSASVPSRERPSRRSLLAVWTRKISWALPWLNCPRQSLSNCRFLSLCQGYDFMRL